MIFEDGGLNLRLEEVVNLDANQQLSQRTRRETDRYKGHDDDSDEEEHHREGILKVLNLEEAHEEFSQFQRADDIFNYYCAKYSAINLKSKETQITNYEITMDDVKDRIVLQGHDDDPSFSFEFSDVSMQMELMKPRIMDTLFRLHIRFVENQQRLFL